MQSIISSEKIKGYKQWNAALTDKIMHIYMHILHNKINQIAPKEDIKVGTMV